MRSLAPTLFLVSLALACRSQPATGDAQPLAGTELIRAFLDAPDPAVLDIGCAATSSRPTFLVPGE